MRRRLHQIPKGATQQGRVAKSPSWGSPGFDYSIPQPSYLDRVPWSLNETTCQPEWRFAHGRGCLQLVQTFAKSEGQNISHVRVPGSQTPAAPEYVGAGKIHDYSPQGNHCTYSHTERRSNPNYRVGFRGSHNWAPNYTHEPSGRDTFDETDSVWSWRSKGRSVPANGRHPRLAPASMIKWLGSTDDHYRGRRDEFTFHSYASWAGRGNSQPDTCLFSLSKGTDDTYDVYLRIGQRQDGYIYARVMTEHANYEDDEGEIESQLHYANTDNLADARYHLISVVLDGGNDELKIFCDGQKLDVTGGTQLGNLWVPNDFSDEALWLCEGTNVNSGGWLGGFAWGGLWGFAWRDQDIHRLSSDVYGLFRMLERPALEVETSEEDANAGTAAATAQALDAGYSLDLGVGVAVSDAVGLTASGQAVVPDTLLKQNQFHLKQNDNLNPLGIF